MHRGVYDVKLVLSKIARVGEGGLATGADKREGGVENNGCLEGLIDILVGIADGDRAHGGGGTATHGNDRNGDVEQEPHESRDVARCVSTFSANRLFRHLDRTIAYNKQENEKEEGQNEIPMVEHLDKEDVAEVAFVGELGEESPGGATACVARIDGVDEVDAQHKGVDDNEEPLL